jgi:hypothetical protein
MADLRQDEILKKYGKLMETRQTEVAPLNNLGNNSGNENGFSREFQNFKEDMMPQFSRYERWCNNIGSILKLKLSSKDEEKIQKEINAAHLDVSPSKVVALAMISFIMVAVFGLLLTVSIYLFSGNFSVLLVFLSFVSAGFLFYYFYTMPSRLANQWRLKAGSQMVPCILYTVIYMKHTSNLERAIRFASQHLEPPLALDLRKVFWDVETGRYSTIKESLDMYLETWRNVNPEFIESFNLIESSLFEPSDARRIQILERALQVILDGVYDKMLKYTHSVKSPLTNIYMLGIVLPTLGLALIPLASALMGGAIKWYVVMVLFNIIVPFFVFYLTNEVMTKRPGGYGESSILERNPLYSQYVSRKPYVKAALICVPLFIIGILPYIFNYTPLADLIGLQRDYTFADFGIASMKDLKFFDFIVTDKGTVGPMGPIALLLSLFVPLSIFLFFYISYLGRTKEIIKSRDYTKILETEFNNSLFQLGNRIGDGMPAELAFGRLSEATKGTVTEDFFKLVNSNIQSLGMSLEKAIFDPKRGAIISYSSNLISTSMHILIESAKKGLRVAAESLMSISDYVKNINKINDRLRDLLSDVISDMKSNMTFLAPLLAGIVVGLASMITLILGKLTTVINNAISSGQGISGYGSIATIVGLFKVENMIPPYLLQVCVGIYIIEITFILTRTLVTVDAGQDKLKETYEISKNLLSAGILYIIVAFLAIVMLSIIASIALGGLAIG